MPLYETVMQEKPPVVLDIGTAYTKLGFAAEPFPRKIIHSEVVRLSTDPNPNRKLFEFANETEFYDKIVDFLQMIFFKYMSISPKERKVVIVENVFGQTVIRETLARALFRHFEVASVLFVPSHMISLSTLAVSTGVVVDIGYAETTVVPVYCGVQIMQSFKDLPCGGRLVHAEIKRQLLATGVKEEYLTEEILENIKVRLCFVTTLERAVAYRGNAPPEPPPSIDYPVHDEVIISVPGRTRETVFEVLFEDTNERDSLPHAILQAILKCPVDVRQKLTESICVIGGGGMIIGLMQRLKAELLHLHAQDPMYVERLHGAVRFKFHKIIGRQNYAAWLGGSICGATDLVHTRSLTKEAYVRNNRVPDWMCLNDNRLSG